MLHMYVVNLPGGIIVYRSTELQGEGTVWLIEAVVYLQAAPLIHLSIIARNGRLHNAL